MYLPSQLNTLFFCLFLVLASASPAPAFDLTPVIDLRQTKRQSPTPNFPDEPASCPVCAADFYKINNCAEAAPVLANFSMIIFNPGAFIDIIMCSCGETFQSVYPQCVDCFIKTGQEHVLSAQNQDLPAVIRGMRQICGMKSALLGNVSGVNGYPSATPSPSEAVDLASGRPLLLSLIALVFSFVGALLTF